MPKKNGENQFQSSVSGKRPKVGVVVGSGGIKAVSSIPLFEFLEEAEIEVDLLLGCSGGSIGVGMWGTGGAGPLREKVRKYWTREMFSQIDYRTLLSIAGVFSGYFDKTRGLIKPQRVHDTLYQLFGDQRMEDLPIPTIFQATDLLSGEPVQLKSGLVRETVYASSALFPILPSICIEGRWLIDGGFSTPLPVMETVMEGMDVIIAMSNEEMSMTESRGFVPNFLRCIQYMTNWLQRNQSMVSVDLHHHEIIFINVVYERFINMNEAHRIPEILKAGGHAVDGKKDEILRAIENFSLL